MEQEFLRKIGFVFLGTLLFAGFFFYTQPPTTGFAVHSYAALDSFGTSFFFTILALVILILALLTRGNPKELFKNLVGILIIFVGFYAIMLIVRETTAAHESAALATLAAHLVVGLLSLTFGVMALIWAYMAYRVLSPGSSLRNHVGSFSFCLLFLLLYSLYDLVLDALRLQGAWIYIKYILITLVYLKFVHASFKVYRLGKEFGFTEQSQRIKKALKK